MRLTMLGAALLVEAVAGYPDRVFRRAGHPVSWAGWLIGRLDRRWNMAALPARVRRRRGIAAIAVVAGAAWSAGRAVSSCGPVATVLAASTLLAARSLHEHVLAVEAGLAQDLPAGRIALARIVGRDTATLNQAGVARAAIESLAENFSDGVVAPALWFAAGGLPAMAVYKAVNTADSMIGHLTARHAAFGWAAARLDDLVNVPASRLSALLIGVSTRHPRAAFRAVARDARRHRSPNAGWPEAAMAGGLGLRLAGPRSYGGVTVEDAWMGDGRAGATAADIGRALAAYRLACFGLLGVVTSVRLGFAPSTGFGRFRFEPMTEMERNRNVKNTIITESLRLNRHHSAT